MPVRRPDRQSGQAVRSQSFRTGRTRDRRRRGRRFHVHPSARRSGGVGFKEWIGHPGRYASLLTQCANLRTHRWPACVGPAEIFFIDQAAPIHLFCIKCCSRAVRKQSIIFLRLSDRKSFSISAATLVLPLFTFIASSPTPRFSGSNLIPTPSAFCKKMSRICLG